MKLIELHLRNIASIERADIDFEHDPGLMDPDTGQAAQKFLIYGDTGTGKSVLLDGIALALYGKTPRIEGVENKTRNLFTNAYGNEMSITSIEQYTRLGISENDECYSEVVFIGNDGVEYRAKMQLGLTRSRGQLKSRKRWFLKAGKNDWIEGTQCGKAIESAVGLTFDQFNRMAMLAQGQFASFLCGSREERADILEKLTNTSLFSKYGKAIRTIYDRRKVAADVARKAFQTAESYILPDEEVKRLQAVLDEEGEKERNAAEAKRSLGVKINLVAKINDNLVRKNDAEARLAQLKVEAEGDDYAAKAALCRDWDETDNERRSMSELLGKRAAFAAAKEREQALHQRFAVLAADVAVRERAFAVEAARIDDEKGWLAERADRDGLYREAPVTLSRMEQLRRSSAAIEELGKEKRLAEGRVEALNKEAQDAEAQRAAAATAAERAQQAIGELLAKVEQLNPKQMDADARSYASLKAAYEKLRGDYGDWLARQKERDGQSAKLSSLGKELDAKRQVRAAAETASATAQAAYEKAMRRLVAIDASLDEKLDELRQTIVAEQTDICPLCGQKIVDKILTREQFALLVTPYEEERRQTRSAAEQAQQALAAATAAVSDIEGRIKVLEDILLNLDKAIEVARGNLSQRMDKAGIAMDGDVDAQIGLHLEQLSEAEEALQRKRDLLAGLQKQLDASLKEKEPLDEALNRATERLAVAKSRVKQNGDRIEELTTKAATAQKELDSDREQIEARIGMWYPQWEERSAEVAEQLKNEAGEYSKRKKDFEDGLAAQRRVRDLLDSVGAIKGSIASVHADWTAAESSATPSADPLKDWTELASQCSAVESTLAECRHTMARCQAELDAWKARSGKDEAYLAALMEKRDALSAARRYLADHEGNVKIWQKVLSDALSDAAGARKSLGLNDDEAVPDKSELERLLAEAEAVEREANRLCTEARTKLDGNVVLLEKLAEAKAAYDKAQQQSDHWYLLDKRFGDSRFRNLVQTHILMPLLNNANLYLGKINDRYTLTCNAENEQLSILVLDRFNRNEVRSAAVLSGGEKFMISLALSLALSSLNRPDLNVNILFIDEGFGTLDQECLNSVMSTLGRLGDMSGQGDRRVGIISHREELLGCIPNKIKLKKIGEGRSKVEIVYEP